VVASVLAFLLISIILFTQVMQGSRETVKVCAILPLSGSGSASAIEVRDGVLIAVDEINEFGGINGRPIELIVVDCETNAAVATEKFRTMEADSPPLFYMTALGSISATVAPLAEEAGAPLIAVVSTDSSLTNGKEWVFRYYAGTEQEVGVGLEFLNQFGIQRLGILSSNDDLGISVSEALKREFEAAGGTAQIERFATSETDFALEIQNVSANEAVYCVAALVQLKQVLVQLNESAYQGLILTTSGAAAPYIISTPEVDGVYLAAPAIYSLANHKAISFAGKFEERYGRPVSAQAASGYDSLEIVAGLLRDHELSRESLREALTGGFVYNGSLGNLTLPAGEHNMAFGLFRARIDGGKLVYI
jgi:branched-chain amino acid transport system substrate-binding protein